MCAQYTLVHTCVNTHRAFQEHSMTWYPQTMVLCFAVSSGGPNAGPHAYAAKSLLAGSVIWGAE